MRIKTLLKLIIGIILLVVLMSYIGIDKIIQDFSKLNLAIAFSTLLILAVVLFLNGINSYILVNAIGQKIKLKKITIYSMMSWAYGLFLPFKLGEFAIIHYMKKEGIDYGQGLVIAMIDRILTMAFLFIVSAIAVYKYFKGDYLFEMILILILGIISFWIFAITDTGRSLIKKYILRKFSDKLKGFSKTLMYLLKKKKLHLTLNFILTGIKWSLTALIMLILFKAIGLSPNFIDVLLITCSAKIFSLLPITINGLGVIESISVFLYNLIGISASIVIVLSLFIRILNYVLAGILITFKEPIFEKLS